MNIKYPDYDNCLVNLSNSILKEFGAKPYHKGLDMLDNHLKAHKQYKNIVTILLDGMGKCILEGNLDKNGFFTSNLTGIYSSVFPPTTVAATTSIQCALYPNEHGWLGWDCYYPQIDKNVTVFRNKIMGSEETAADYNVADRYYHYVDIVDLIKENGGKAYSVTPFVNPFPKSFADICNEVEKRCKEPERKYIYAYWSEPDHTMHEKGCYCDEIKEILKNLERSVKELSEKLEDTLLIVTADHGHLNTKGLWLGNYPKIEECLVRTPCIEPRALNFFVKDGMKEQFENEFNKEFGEIYKLIPRKEFLEGSLFGTGNNHKDFESMVGDYIGASISDTVVYPFKDMVTLFIGTHAGLTEDEMNIPLILISK